MAAVSFERGAGGPLAVGAKLGRYEILAKLAAGGMAIVYVARVQGVAGFERLVAIKVLHSNLAHEDEFIRMFLDEARLAASIRHPNVVPTIDISDSVEAGYFIVMEYIEGDHLGALLSGAHKAAEKLPLPIVLRIIADVLGGLGAAHDLCDETGKSLHLVHRDVSPHNIMVGRDGVARLTDFGVAKAEDRLTHTRDGQVKGKLAYMAPEQAGSGQTDSRSDLFSMGVILWECITGQRLFRADNTAATLHKLLHGEIPAPSSVDPLLEPLDALLGRALARDLAQRFQSAEEFARAIEEVAPHFGGLSSLRGVARVVKHHTAQKLKREQKLIDDALNSLRPAEPLPPSSDASEDETTSPSVSEISISSGSLSASKVSGVFSHDTLPGARRPLVLKNVDEPVTSAMRPVPPPPAGNADLPMRGAASRSSANRPVVDPGAVTAVARSARARWLWLAAAVFICGVAVWVLRSAHPEQRASTPLPPPASSLMSEPLVPPLEQANSVESGAHVPVSAVPLSLVLAPAPAPVGVPPERAARPVKRDEPSDSKSSSHRARRDRAESRRSERSPTRPDLIPNPYHN